MGPKFRSFTDSLNDTARLHSKAGTQAHEQISGLKRSITKIERRIVIAVKHGNMVQVLKLTDLLKVQSASLLREVDRFNAEFHNAAKRQGKDKDTSKVLPRLDTPSRDQHQFEETNGQRKVRVKAVSHKT